ncbi:MAG: hypothetical protein PHU00_10615, partial [Bacteroidales bacterium]|nr:hypothetical protein [Bacteroidales bacterium]
MKLLIVNPFGVGTYDDPILNSVRQVVRKDTEVSVMHLKKGLYFIRNAYFQMLLLPDVVETKIQA